MLIISYENKKKWASYSPLSKQELIATGNLKKNEDTKELDIIDGTLEIPNDIYGIQEWGFSKNNNGLEHLIFHGDIKIRFGAFDYCLNLKTIRFKEDLSEIITCPFMHGPNFQYYIVERDDKFESIKSKLPKQYHAKVIQARVYDRFHATYKNIAPVEVYSDTNSSAINALATKLHSKNCISVIKKNLINLKPESFDIESEKKQYQQLLTDVILADLKTAIKAQFEEDKLGVFLGQSFFSCFRNTALDTRTFADLQSLVTHAIEDKTSFGGINRTAKVLEKVGLVTISGNDVRPTNTLAEILPTKVSVPQAVHRLS